MAGTFAKGTVLSVTVAAVLTPVLNLTGISGVEITSDEVDVTDHDSVDNYKEFVQGLKDGGSVSLEGNFTNHASQIALKTLLDSGAVVACEIQFPNSLANWAFNAFVSSLSTDAPYDGKIGIAATLKVSGKPTLTTGA